MKGQGKIAITSGILILCVVVLTLAPMIHKQQPSYKMTEQDEQEDNDSENKVTDKKARAGHPKNDTCIKRLPQAIIIGIQKCGTTTLLTFLNRHPEIVACLKPVETQFFSGRYSRGLGWYKNLMPCSYANQITMEKSPPYFYREFCATRIRKMNPNIKLIITVKEPIERAISMYAMLEDYGKVKGIPFEDYVMSNNRTEVRRDKKMIQFSNYPRYMKFWVKYFDLEQILFIDGDRFVTNPSEELKKVEQFLGIGNYFTPERFVFNETKGKYCILENGEPSCMAKKKGRPHPTIDPEVRQKLQQFFKPLNKQFFKIINRTFDWGY
ncbi:hypothetical protein ACF0H5_024067 [Mactra antiquata]